MITCFDKIFWIKYSTTFFFSGDPWTLLIPQNSGLPKGNDVSSDLLLGHAILGTIVDPKKVPVAETTLADTPVIFTEVNGGYTNFL